MEPTTSAAAAAADADAAAAALQASSSSRSKTWSASPATRSIAIQAGPARPTCKVGIYLCGICQDELIDTVLWPCLHMIGRDCATRLKYCPACRGWIEQALKMFPITTDIGS